LTYIGRRYDPFGHMHVDQYRIELVIFDNFPFSYLFITCTSYSHQTGNDDRKDDSIDSVHALVPLILLEAQFESETHPKFKTSKLKNLYCSVNSLCV
jgi:hypothetical protein